MNKKLLILTDLLEILDTEYDGEFKRNKGETIIYKRKDNKYYDENDTIINSNIASALLSYYVCGGSNTIYFEPKVFTAKCLLCDEEFEYDSSEGLKHTCKSIWWNEECDK